MNRLRRTCHRFQEGILAVRLLKHIARVGICAGGVDTGLTVRSGDADALVFQHTAEASHGMAFEVGEVDHEVVVGEMASDKVFREPFCVLHGQCHGPFFIHDVDSGDFSIAALLYGAAVSGGILAVPAVCCVALHDCTFYLLDKSAYKFGAQMIALG